MRIASSRGEEEKKEDHSRPSDRIGGASRRHFTEERMLTSPDSQDAFGKGDMRLGRGHSVDISSHPLFRGQNQVLSRG